MPEPPGITDWVLTTHALRPLERRSIALEIVKVVLEAPGQRVPVRPGREVLQRKVLLGEPPREYVVRVFVDLDRVPAQVVTVYRTSQVAKYWRSDP